MPDFKTINLAAPFRVSRSWGTVEQELLISEPAEFAVQQMSMHDAKPVASVFLDDESDTDGVPYVSLEGRLFRPLLRNDGRYDSLGGARRSSYPLLMFKDVRRTSNRRTNLLVAVPTRGRLDG